MSKLDQCWTNCIKMWKWISKNLPRWFRWKNREDKKAIVKTLKKKWLTKNGFGGSRVLMDCFFCEFSSDGCGDVLCCKCPGRLADLNFHCNHCPDSINWVLNPKKFYKNLVKINKKRLEN